MHSVTPVFLPSLTKNVFPSHVMLRFPAGCPALVEVGPEGPSTRYPPTETRVWKTADSLHLPAAPSWRVSVSSQGGLGLHLCGGLARNRGMAPPDPGRVTAASHSEHVCSDSTFLWRAARNPDLGIICLQGSRSVGKGSCERR